MQNCRMTLLLANRLSCVIRAKTVQEVLTLCDGFYPRFKSPEGKTEYFFNHNPDNFNSILDIYRIGKLHRTKSTCALTYVNCLEYWGFNELFLEPCCALDYYVEKDYGQKEQEGERIARKRRNQRLIEESFGNSYVGQIRQYLWNLTEYPETTIEARVRQYVHSYE